MKLKPLWVYFKVRSLDVSELGTMKTFHFIPTDTRVSHPISQAGIHVAAMCLHCVLLNQKFLVVLNSKAPPHLRPYNSGQYIWFVVFYNYFRDDILVIE